MQSAGWHGINPYLEDNPLPPAERPIYGTAKFRLRGKWYLFDHVRLHLREALELDIPKTYRSAEAQWLEVCLHSDQLDAYAVFRARDKLTEIYERLRPIH